MNFSKRSTHSQYAYTSRSNEALPEHPSCSFLVTGQWRSHPHGLLFPTGSQNTAALWFVRASFHPSNRSQLVVQPEGASLRGCASIAKHLGQFYPLRGAHNLRPITPYLDENLTSPSNTLFLSMINDPISRLKNTLFLPKGEMPNYSHLERPSFVLPCQKAIRTPFQSRISRNSLTSTRLSGAFLFSARLARPWMVGYSFEIVQRAQCSRSSNV